MKERLLAERDVEIDVMKEFIEKVPAVSDRRALVELASSRSISVSRACELAGVSRRRLGYVPRRGDGKLVARLMDVAKENPRYGCRHLCAMLRRDGLLVNIKRVRRLCREHGLLLRQKRRRNWLIDARLPRKELIRRIEAIAAKRKAITVKKMNAEAFIRHHLSNLPKDALVYCDPPVLQEGGRLYLNHYKPEDHLRVAQVVQKYIRQHWVVSYDGAPEIIRNYSKRRHFLYDLQYNAHKAYKGTEVFFLSDALALPEESILAPIDAGLKRLVG